jgi:malonyl CoA-acyl carrier protein transacylase
MDGYVVLANVNSTRQVVLGGATEAVGRAADALRARGHDVFALPVSHAFHTEIVAGASGPLRATLQRLGLREPALPIVANVDGELYPTGVEAMLDVLARQVASPVQFVKGLRTLYDEGARVFVEVGPKRALQGFAADVLGDEVLSLATNHPKAGDIATFNNALCGLWAAGLGEGIESAPRPVAKTAPPPAPVSPPTPARVSPPDDLAALFAEFLERGRALLGSSEEPRETDPVVITGAALGLPGAERLFDDANVGRLLEGEQGIDVIPSRLRREMLDKHITRLVKGDDGSASFETIDRPDDVIKLAARAGAFDLGEQFGVDTDRLAALGRDTQLAIAAGIDALRDAGIPLVRRYRTTSTGSQLPDRWRLPDALRDEVGVIFASAFPGLEEMTAEVTHATEDRMRRERLAALESLRARMLDHGETDPIVLEEVERRIHDVRHQVESEPYEFDRRFLFRVLSMGHSQLAEHIGARGPNTQVNSACASTTQAVAIAEDWIRAGRCRRVVIVAADDATSDTMLGWLGAGFLASGAAATDEVVEDAALPFDQRRHGMILGMGAAALVVESAAAARERGMTPICEVLGSVTANSAFHGTRLDVEHIGGVMENVVAQAERRGVARGEMAPATVFVSHETYTPARGGSASAEIHALRRVFGDRADSIVIANTKGLTGHPMGVGLEDVAAVKALETGVVPPVPNHRDVDPELGPLNLSHGGAYPIRYALRLAAGFGSQISMILLRWTPPADGRRRRVDELGYGYRVADRDTFASWLRRVSGHDDPKLEVVARTLRVADGVPAVPVPAPEPEPERVSEPEPVAVTDDVESRVLAIVAEQTGYPEDLLDMDLDLEADLGIDTVKQAEVFATIREAYGIERDDSLKLRDYPTLNAVVGFVRERAGGAVAETTAISETVDETVADDYPRRIPVPVLRPPLDRCADTGVTLTNSTRVKVVPDRGGVAAALTKRLAKFGVEIADDGPVDGVYWLPALDPDDARVKELAATMRELPPETFLVAGTRLGGRHGYDTAGAINPLGGAVTGFTKALARERADTLIKAVDFPAGRKTAALADTLIEETLRDPGAVEIGHADGLRWSVGLDEQPATPDPARALKADDVFLLTGAAGSIVSAIAADLAQASHGTFHLLDLVPAPDPQDPDLARFASDKDGLKRELADRLREHGEKPTPKLVERELARIERARAAQDAIDAIHAAGGTAHWHQADLTNRDQVAAAVADAIATSGRIDVLVHAGGLEISHFLPDKPQREFDLVFDVKADGWQNILDALPALPRATVVFSSIAGRFGNAGQTDYSAANDLLCKATSNLRAQGVHAIAIDWTAWSGIGMASRGSIPTVMKAAGIDMLPPEQGIPVVRRELTAAGPGSEVLVAGALGVLTEERHPTGGLDPQRAAGDGAAGPLIGRVAAVASTGELSVLTELDPARQPFLNDHRIDGTPVLPGVMGIEAFAEAAHVLAPGWHVASVEDVELLAPFKFYRDEPRTLELRARVRDGGDGTLVADCRLAGRRALAAGEQETLHFTGRARLTQRAPDAPTTTTPEPAGTTVDRDAVYKVYFHGPAYQVLERAWRDNGHVVGALAGDLPADQASAETHTEFVPRLIELCFQTAGVFELGTEGRMALPTHVDRVVRYAGADEPGRLFAIISHRPHGVDAEVVDATGRVRIRLEGYRTIELPGGVDEDALAPIRAAMGKG